jgi:hypothetical protein
MARPRVRKHGCGHAPARSGLGRGDSLECLRAPAAARSSWTFHVLVLTVAVRLPCEPVGVFRLGAGVVDAAAAMPRAAPQVTRELLRVGVRGKRAPECW